MVVTRLRKIKDATGNENIKTLMQGIDVLIENMGSPIDETEYQWNILTKYAENMVDVGGNVMIQLTKEQYEEEKAFLKGKTYVEIDFSSLEVEEPIVLKKEEGTVIMYKEQMKMQGITNNDLEIKVYSFAPLMMVMITKDLSLIFGPEEEEFKNKFGIVIINGLV